MSSLLEVVESVKASREENATSAQITNAAIDLLKFAAISAGTKTTDGKPASELIDKLHVTDKDFTTSVPPLSTPSVEKAEEKKTMTLDLGGFAQIFGAETGPVVADAMNFAGALVNRINSKFEAQREWCKSERANTITQDFVKDPKIFLQTIPEKFTYDGEFTKALSVAYSIREVIIEEDVEEDDDEEDESNLERNAKLIDALKDALYSVIRVVDPLPQQLLPDLPSLGLVKKSGALPDCKLQ